LLTKQLPPLPWPKVEFAQHFPEQAEPLRMIRRCFPDPNFRFDDFLDWLLLGFGGFDANKQRLQKAEHAEHWERTFNLKLLLESPGDWLGHYYETEIASHGMRAASGFFTTPPSVCRLLVEMNKPSLLDTVHEPCCGTGRILMEASNYSLNLSGADINPTLVKIATINGWLYMPPLVMPCKEISRSQASTMIVFDRKLKNTLLMKGDYNDQTRNNDRISPKNGAP
jgi:hypothetical protein